MASTTTSQLSCFSTLNHRSRSVLLPILRPQSWNVSNGEGSSLKRLNQFGLSYASNSPRIGVEKTDNSYASIDKVDEVEEENVNGNIKEIVSEQKKSAKIHDFCFGIPFGGIILSGGLFGFMFSRNVATLGTGVLYGGALLALSTYSMKIWRQGKSSLPFILGQGALAAALLWKNFQTFSITKKLFPTGFYAAISAAMLCFYSYVLLSGGNPPPKKKLKPSMNVAS